jgi:flagellar hook-associated protein 2
MSTTIDGLISGIDTQSVIDGLLKVSQSQIDRLNTNKSEIVAKQTAFNGIEAQLVSLRGKLSSLGRSQNNVLEGKIATSSDEDTLQVSANSDAINGNYTITVNSLAATHQLASSVFESADSQITEGTLSIQVGNGSEATVTIDSSNNSVQGLVDAINATTEDAFASLVTDSNGTRILLTGRQSGAEETIQITNNLGPTSGSATQPDFSGAPVQVATDASIQIGSGAGAITVSSASNQFEGVIEGLTINVSSANPSKPVNIGVSNDVESSTTAIEGFVDAFNSLMDFIDSQSRYDAESNRAGTLLGNRNVQAIQNEIRNRLVFSVSGIDSNLNQLSAIGLKFNDSGKIFIDSAQLSKVLSGQMDGVDTSDVKRLFSLDGQSTNSGVEFLLGSTETQSSGSPVEVDITQAAERAVVTAGTSLAASTVIDSSNNTFAITVDGKESGTLQLAEGSYTQTELAEHVESVINNASDFSGQSVTASVINGYLKIQSDQYGLQSEIAAFSGSALTDLGLTTGDSDTGQDVVGRFIVDGEIEEAVGSGRLLIGSSDNENTADLQVRVTLNSSQVTSEIESELTITRGFASQLDQIIGDMLDPVTGKIKTVKDSFNEQIESIDLSITNTEELIQLKSDQLISEFVAMEQALSSLQNTSSILLSQFAAG